MCERPTYFIMCLSFLFILCSSMCIYAPKCWCWWMVQCCFIGRCVYSHRHKKVLISRSRVLFCSQHCTRSAHVRVAHGSVLIFIIFKMQNKDSECKQQQQQKHHYPNRTSSSLKWSRIRLFFIFFFSNKAVRYHTRMNNIFTCIAFIKSVKPYWMDIDWMRKSVAFTSMWLLCSHLTHTHSHSLVPLPHLTNSWLC